MTEDAFQPPKLGVDEDTFQSSELKVRRNCGNMVVDNADTAVGAVVDADQSVNVWLVSPDKLETPRISFKTPMEVSANSRSFPVALEGVVVVVGSNEKSRESFLFDGFMPGIKLSRAAGEASLLSVGAMTFKMVALGLFVLLEFNPDIKHSTYSLHSLLHYFTQRDSNVYVALLDFSKAFDTISHSAAQKDGHRLSYD